MLNGGQNVKIKCFNFVSYYTNSGTELSWIFQNYNLSVIFSLLCWKQIWPTISLDKGNRRKCKLLHFFLYLIQRLILIVDQSGAPEDLTLMYFNDDNPLGLIKSCHSVGKIKFPSSEEEKKGSRQCGSVFSCEIVSIYSHNCLYPWLACQDSVGLMRKLSRCLLSPLITRGM